MSGASDLPFVHRLGTDSSAARAMRWVMTAPLLREATERLHFRLGTPAWCASSMYDARPDTDLVCVSVSSTSSRSGSAEPYVMASAQINLSTAGRQLASNCAVRLRRWQLSAARSWAHYVSTSHSTLVAVSRLALWLLLTARTVRWQPQLRNSPGA